MRALTCLAMMPIFGAADGPVMPPEFPRVDPGAPALTTAIEERLGLELDPARGPIDMLIIDRVQRPTEN